MSNSQHFEIPYAWFKIYYMGWEEYATKCKYAKWWGPFEVIL